MVYRYDVKDFHFRISINSPIYKKYEKYFNKETQYFHFPKNNPQVRDKFRKFYYFLALYAIWRNSDRINDISDRVNDISGEIQYLQLVEDFQKLLHKYLNNNHYKITYKGVSTYSTNISDDEIKQFYQFITEILKIIIFI